MGDSPFDHDQRTTKRLAMQTYLEEVNICSLVGRLETRQEKTNILEAVLKTGMDILVPLTSKAVLTNEPSWIKQLKSVINQRQITFAGGSLHVSFRRLRNRVHRLPRLILRVQSRGLKEL